MRHDRQSYEGRRQEEDEKEFSMEYLLVQLSPDKQKLYVTQPNGYCVLYAVFI